jgi:hypothetical protein
VPISEARSAYVLEDRASPALRGIRDEAKRTTLGLRATAGELDKIGSPSQLQRIERLDRRFSSLAGTVERTQGRVDSSMRRMEGSIRRSTLAAEGRLEGLGRKMDELGNRTARPRVELDGYALMRGQLASLQHQLNQVGRGTTTARVRMAGPGAVGGGLGGGAGRSGAFAGSQGAGFFTTRTGLIAGGALAGLPLAQGLIGASLPVLGSAAGAGLGLGGAYAAGGGALGAGLGGIVALALPAKKGIENLTKAQQKYNAVVADYGAKSKEAAKARHELNQAEEHAAPGAARLLRERTQLAQTWARVSRPGQRALLGGTADALADVRRASPFLGRQANMIGAATGRAEGAFASYMTSPQGLIIVRDLSRTFASNIDEAEQTAENLVGTFGNIARASSPFFHEGMVFVRDWTGRWEQSTRDISDTRRQIGGYVDDLRAWGHLAGASFDLVRDLIMPGRHQGTSLVEDLTGQLREWDRWAQRNPDRLHDFFSESIDSTKTLAGLIGTITHDLHVAADLLGPFVTRFAQLANIAGGAGLLLPSLLRYGLGRAVGRRGGGAEAAAMAPAGAGAAGGVPMAVPVGAGVAAGAAGVAGARALSGSELAFQRVYGAYGVEAPRSVVGGPRYGAPVQVGQMRTLAGDVTTAGRYAGGKLLAGARFAAPVLGVNAALQAGTTAGNFNERFQAGVSGLTLGLVPMPVTGAQARQQGTAQALDFVQSQGDARSFGGLRGQIAALERRRRDALARSTTTPGHGIFGGRGTLGIFEAGRGGDTGPSETEAKRNAAAAKQYAGSIRELRGELRSYRRELERQHDVESQQHGAGLFDSFRQAYKTLRGKEGPEQAMKDTLDSVFTKMRGMRPAGARILGENSLAWARELEKKNPAISGTVDKLAQRIERRFSRMGERVRIVNGRILDGSRSEWKGIAEAIYTPAELAQQKVHDAFTAIQREAIGSLEAMGMSPQQARSYVAGQEAVHAGTSTPASARHAGDPGGGRGGPSGDGIGDGVGGDRWGRDSARRARTNTAGGIGSLMGAKPGLSVYDDAARRFGLHVSSGLRPGAITASGNVSLHASGDALDESGSAAGMLRFARYMAEHYGSGLDELIHTPLGYGIKNGRRVPLSFWGGAINAQHVGHVHVGDRTPAAGGGLGGPMGVFAGGAGGRVRLHAPRIGVGGVPGALGQRAADLYAAALSHKLTGAGAVGGGGRERGKYGEEGLERLWIRAGGSPAQARLMAAIALRESGGNPNATHLNTNGTLDRGLWQINSVWGNWSRFGALANARSAVHVMAVQGPRAWATYNAATDAKYLGGLGDGTGHVPWYRAGVDGVARRPMVIGVGDHPRGEDVTVTPRRLGPPRRRAGGIGAAGISVTIQRMEVQYNAKGDLKRVVRDELREAFEELREELDDGVDADEEALLR